MIEIAPGMDLANDILAQMDFVPSCAIHPGSWMSVFSCLNRWGCATACSQYRSRNASVTTPSRTYFSSILSAWPSRRSTTSRGFVR